MFSSKYWPSKALLWKDWRLSMPIFLLWVSFVTYISTLTLVYHLVRYRTGGIWFEGYWHGFSEFHDLLRSETGLLGIAIVMFVVVLGAVALGQERERGTLSLLASMPYSRRDILLSKALVALAQLSLPFIANALLMTAILGMNRGVNFPFGATAVWTWAGHSVVVLSFVLGVTLLASTVSGKTWGAAFLALVMLFFPFGMYMLVELNAGHWYRTGLLPATWSLFGPWEDLVNDAATHLTIPTWIVDFPTVLAIRSRTYVDLTRVDLAFANRVWAFLHEHTYILYLALVGLSLGAYAWAQKWFVASRLEHDGELLALPRLRSLIGIGFTACSALLGGALLPEIFHADGLGRLAMILFSYVSSAAVAWLLVCRFLGTTPAPHGGTPRKTTTMTIAALLLVVVVLVGVLLVAMFGGLPRQLSSTQVVPLLALAEEVMVRRTTALVTDGPVPLAALSNELASESTELRSREQAAMAEIGLRREELRQRGETYVGSETQLTLLGSSVRQNTATLTTRELTKLYFTLVHPNQPEYTAWSVYREFEFVKHGQRWELTATTLLSTGKGAPPPNAPSGK